MKLIRDYNVSGKISNITLSVPICENTYVLPYNWFKRPLYILNIHVAVILSGDVHLAELIPYPCSESGLLEYSVYFIYYIVLGYQLYELTSSGLTHTSRDHFKQGELFDKLFFPETYNVN